MAQDILTEAREAYEDCREDMHAQHKRMTEDLLFSNPADPKQWEEQALQIRKGRPCLTFDRTNQFIMQVVNDGRKSKPSMHAMPCNEGADEDVADKLNGMFRHIEHVSRAGAAYDMMLEHQARVGLGWLRVVPEIIRPETNEQEIRIMRVHDPKSVMLQAGWTAHDGSDAKHGFAETLYSKRQFKAMWPKHKDTSWEGEAGSWFTDESVRVAEYFKVEETKKNKIVAQLNGQTGTYDEEDYWKNAKPAGASLVSNFTHKERKVRWIKMSGAEVLEETEFPSQYIPLIPGLGYELWIEGKRYLCGLPRRMRDSQKQYNYLQSALTESLALQPKAPFTVPLEALEDLEQDWKQLNTGSPAYLPYNHKDSDGDPIPAPTRLAPPAFPVAFANAAQIASQDMESSVGMFKANLGQQGNEISGRAINARAQQGDTANFHYVDNRDRAIERLGTIVMDMLPRIYDTARQARIMAEDGKQDFVHVDPDLAHPQTGQPLPKIKQGKKVVAINITTGDYDVRVKSGPAFTTLLEEQAEQLSRIMQSAPDLTPILADLWVKAQNIPDGEKAAKRLAAMLPPQIQQMESEEGEELPPEALQQIQLKDAQIAELSHSLETAHSEHMDLEQQMKAGTAVEQMKAQNAQAIKAAELQNESAKAQMAEKIRLTIAREQTASAERIAREHDASTERIAKLNAELTLIQLQADQLAAEKARQDEAVLEGQRMSVDKQKHDETLAATEKANQQKAEADKAKTEQAAKQKPEPKAEPVDIQKHLAPLHQAIKELQTTAAKPRKSSVKIIKQPDGSFVGEKVES